MSYYSNNLHPYKISVKNLYFLQVIARPSKYDIQLRAVMEGDNLKVEKLFSLSPLLPLLVLTSISFVIRLWGIGDAPFWINEADNSRQLLFDTPRDKIAWTVAGAGLYLGDVIIRELVLFFIPHEILHNGEAGLRIPSAFACSISIPLVYKLASRFCESDMSWIVTLSWAFNPFAIDWSQDVSTYGMWPIWATFLLLATFRFTSSIKRNELTLLDWILFHSAMIGVITSNLFILMISAALFPHVVSTIILQYQERKERLRILLCAYGPHFVPGLIFTYTTIKPVFDPSIHDNSWMSSANWNTPLELMLILFPNPESIGASVIAILLIIGMLKNLHRIGRTSPILILQNEYSALFLAGTLQLFCFLFLQLLDSPSWATRYMLHLIPIWLILIAACISPIDPISSAEGKVNYYSFSNLGKAVILILTVLTIFSLGPATDMGGQDTRGAWELVSEDYDEIEIQVILTQPSEYFYIFYLEIFELEPDVFEGSWYDFTDDELVELIPLETDSVHRIRLEGHNDINLANFLAEDYFLARESSSKGMVVEHWVRING